MTEEQLKAIEARAAAATPGPWKLRADAEVPGWLNVHTINPDAISKAWHPNEPPIPDHHEICVMVGENLGLNDYTDAHMMPNANFIAHSREDVPALIAEVRRLRAEIERGDPQARRWANLLAAAGEEETNA